MSNLEIRRYRSRLENLFELAGKLQDDPELLSHWARYLCVLASGFLEVSVRAIFGEYARNMATPQVARYVEKQLKGFQSAKMGSILELTGAFSPEWRDSLEDACAGEPGDAVNSIVTNRHQIAHGADVGITYHAIKRYYERSLKVVETLEALCKV